MGLHALVGDKISSWGGQCHRYLLSQPYIHREHASVLSPVQYLTLCLQFEEVGASRGGLRLVDGVLYLAMIGWPNSGPF
jgi:hypothetical protein